MKLLRFGACGAERPGLIFNDGSIRDLGAHVDDLTADWLKPEGLSRIAAIDARGLPVKMTKPYNLRSLDLYGIASSRIDALARGTLGN